MFPLIVPNTTRYRLLYKCVQILNTNTIGLDCKGKQTKSRSSSGFHECIQMTMAGLTSFLDTCVKQETSVGTGEAWYRF